MAAAEQQALQREAQIWLCGGHEGGDAAGARPQDHQGEHARALSSIPSSTQRRSSALLIRGA